MFYFRTAIMKKVVAFLLAVLYLIFTSFTFWNVNDEDGPFVHRVFDADKSIIATTDGKEKKAINHDILFDKSLNKASKHLTVTRKRNLSRTGFVILSSKNFPSLSTTGYYKPEISWAIPLLYHSAIYLKNGVLRI